jgi:hypothetical protein
MAQANPFTRNASQSSPILTIRTLSPYAAVLSVAAFAFVFYLYHQPTASFRRVPMMDANQYLHIYNYLKGGESSPQAVFPFHSRVVVPWLATLVPAKDPVAAFQTINFVFTLLSAGVLLWLWRQLGFRPEALAVGFFWLFFHWTGLVRLNAFDPVTVDVPLYLFQALLLWIVLRGRWRHLWWLAPLATAQKESFPALLVVLLAYGWLYNVRTKTRIFPLATIVGCLLLSVGTKTILNAVFPPLKPGSSVITVLYFVKETLADPFRAVRWAVGVFVAFGGWLLLAMQQWMRKGGFGRLGAALAERRLPMFGSVTEDVLFVFTATSFGLGLVAGGDFTRIVFLGFPFAMTYILLLVQSAGLSLWVAAGLLSLPLMRLTEPVPDPGADWTAFVNWYPEFASWQVVLAWFGYGCFCFAVLYLLQIRSRPRSD